MSEVSAPELPVEQEALFRRRWLYVGRDEEIPHPGDYLTLRVLDEPILVLRLATGGIRALSNRCLHHGLDIMRGSGRAAELTCPYHGWTYDLDGRLVDAPQLRWQSQLRHCRLPERRLEAWRGFLFANLDPDAPPLAASLGRVEIVLGPLAPEDYRLAARLSVTLDSDWRMLVEELRAGNDPPGRRIELLAPSVTCAGHAERIELHAAYPLSRRRTALLCATLLPRDAWAESDLAAETQRCRDVVDGIAASVHGTMPYPSRSTTIGASP